MYLYSNCLDIAHSDLKLFFFCYKALTAMVDRMAKTKRYLYLVKSLLEKGEYDRAILYCEKCLEIAQQFPGYKKVEGAAYMFLADAHLMKEENDDAILYSRKGLAIAQESGLLEVEIEAYKRLGNALLNKKEYDDATLYSEKCLEIAQRSSEHKEIEIVAYMMLGSAHLMKQENDDVIVYGKKCLAIAQESGNEEAQMNAYIKLGLAHLGKEEYDDAILCSEKGLAIAQKTGHKEAEMCAYMTLESAYLKKKEYDFVTLYTKKYLDIVQESGDKVAEIDAYKTLEDVHLEKEEYDDAILYGKKRLHIAERSGDKVAKINAYNALGFAHFKKEKYNDAILYGEKSLSIAQSSGDKVEEISAYIFLANAHLKKKQCDDAILYSEKCLAIAQESGYKIKGEMCAYSTLGEAHLKKKEYDDAISYSEKCLTIAEQFGVREIEMKAYMVLGEAHLKKEEYDDAILYSEKCLAIAQDYGVKVAEMNANMTLGNAYLHKDKYNDAIVFSKRCLAIAQEFGHKEAEMCAYMTLGSAYLNKMEYDDAILYGKKCVAIAQEFGPTKTEMNAHMTLANAYLLKMKYDGVILCSKKWLAIAQEFDDKVEERNAYMMLGIAHMKKREYDDAILYSKKCLAIAQEPGDIKETGMIAYMNLGEAHLAKGEYDDAILYSEKCLAIAQDSGVKVVKKNAHVTLGDTFFDKKEYGDLKFCSKKCLVYALEYGEKVAEMKAYGTLGDAHLGKDEYDDAIFYSERCLDIAQEIGHKVNEMNAYMTLGYAHLNNNQYDDAIRYSGKCVDIAQEFGYKVAGLKAYKALGNAHFEKENYGDAHVWFTEGISTAIDLDDIDGMIFFTYHLKMIFEVVGVLEEYVDLCRKTDDVNEAPDDENQILPDWLRCFILYEYHRARHEYEKAISYLEETMAAASQVLDICSTKRMFRPPPWTFKHGMSEMYVLLGQYEEGLQCHQEALDIARKKGTKSEQAISHCSLGEVYYKLQQFEKAEESLKESLQCYEPVFESLKQNDRLKIAFVDNRQKKAYKMLLKVLIERNKEEKALVLSDHYRAKALKDRLVSSYGMKKEQIAKEGLQYADVQSLVSSSKYTLLFYSTCFEKLCTFLVEAGNELEFSVQYFEYCDTCLDKLVDKTFDDMKVRQIVNCEDRSVDVMDDSEENKNCEKDELAQLLARQKEKRSSEQCRSICGCRGNPSENSNDSSLTSGLEILYHKLIHNIKCFIKQDEIVIFPEGPLYKVPFAALLDPDTGQYLSETKRIRMAPSMASLKLLQECQVEHHSSKDALIIGAPVVGRVKLNGLETEIPTLLGALDEAIDIRLILGVQALVGANATKPAVIKRLQEGASVIHIAAHGNLEKATIVLAPSPEIIDSRIPDEEDYMLTMADVQAIQVRSQLVVLSCCHSGRGQIKAEGVIGMCRAFLASGARAVVGSLWAVDDHATRKFMETFYTHLKDGKSASTSLHLTMKEMRRMPQYCEPKYWAPFFLMGDDVTIQFED